MKKLLIVIAALAIGLSANAASYCWGMLSADYLAPDGSGYDDGEGLNLYSGGTAFLYLGTVAYDNGFVTTGATYLDHAGYDAVNYGYGRALDLDTTAMGSSTDVLAAGGQAYSIVFVDANVTSLDDSNIENYIIITGTSENGYDPGTETSFAQMMDYTATPGSGSYAWSSAEAVPEPTSGLLLLLGMAGLALKRKRA